MKTRPKIISSSTYRPSFGINPSRLVETRRILCRNTLNTKRHTLNKISEGCNDWRHHNIVIVTISQIFYLSFLYTLLSTPPNLATKIQNNHLTDGFKHFKVYQESCDKSMSREHTLLKTTLSRLVYLATVDLKNGLFKIYILVVNLFDTNLVFSILLESLYLLPYKFFHFKSSKKTPAHILLSQSISTLSSSFFNRNKRTLTIIQWFSIVLLPLIIYRTSTSLYINRNAFHVVNMMDKHVDSSVFDAHKHYHYDHQIFYSEPRLLHKNVLDIDLYQNLKSYPLLLNVKSINTTYLSNQNTVNSHILNTHIQYKNKLTNFVQRTVWNIQRLILTISTAGSKLKTSTLYCEMMLVSTEKSESNTFEKYTVSEMNLDQSLEVHNNQIYLYRFLYKYVFNQKWFKFKYYYYCLKRIDNKLNWLANLIDSTHQFLRYKIEEFEPFFFRFRYTCKLRFHYQVDHFCNLKVLKTSSRSIKHRIDLNQFVNVVLAQIDGTYPNVLHKDNSLISVVRFWLYKIFHNPNTIHSKLNKDYTNLFVTNDILNKLDEKNVFMSKTLANTSCNLTQPVQRVSRLCNNIRWHSVSNLLVSHKDTKTKSVHTFSKRIDVVLYEQIQRELKSIRQPTNWVDCFGTKSPIQLKWNQNTKESTLLNLQQLFVSPNVNTIGDLINEFDSSFVKKKVNISKLHNDLQPNQWFFETNLDDKKSLLIDPEYSHFNHLHELVASNKLSLFQNYRGWILTPQWWISFEKTLTKTIPFVSQNVSDWIRYLFLSVSFKSVSFKSVFFKPVFFQQIQNTAISNRILSQSVFDTLNHYFDTLNHYFDTLNHYFDTLNHYTAISNRVLSQSVFDTKNHLKRSVFNQLRTNSSWIQVLSFNVFEFRIFVCTIMICLLYFNGVILNWFLWNKFSIICDWRNPSFHRRQQLLKYKAFKYYDASANKMRKADWHGYTTFRTVSWYDFKLRDFDFDDMVDFLFGGDYSEMMREFVWFDTPMRQTLHSFKKKIWKQFESNCFETLVFPGSIVDFSPRQIKKGVVMLSMLEDVSLQLNKIQKPPAFRLYTEIINGLGFQGLDKLNNSYQIYSSQLKHEVNHLYDSKNLYFASSSFNRDLTQFVSSSPVNFSTDLGSTTRNMSPLPIQINQRESTIGFELTYKYKAFLLIESAKTELGMFSLITNLTNTLRIPLIRIPIDRLIYSSIHPNISVGHHLSTLVQNLDKMLFRIDLIRSLNSCLVWISDLRSYTKSRRKRNKEKAMLLSILLKTIQNVSSKKTHCNINFVITSREVRFVDPSIIFSQHFNLASLQIPNKSQSQTNLVHLLYTHNLHLKYKLLLNQIVDKTVGRGWMFLEGLIKNISVIAKKQHKNVVDDSMVKLAFSRQSFQHKNTSIVLPLLERSTIVPFPLKRYSNSVVLSTVSNNVFWDTTWCLEELTSYKIGQHIVKSLFHNLPSVLGYVLPMHAQLWREDFYFLATGYLEISFKNSTITKSIIFAYILICLAGLAAQDAAIISVSNIIENRFVINEGMEQDYKLALRLSASLFSELASKDTYGSQLMCHSKHCLLPKFGIENYPCSFDFSNYRASVPVYMQLLNVLAPANAFSFRFKPNLDLKQNELVTEKHRLIWSKIITRLNISSKPSFKIIDNISRKSQVALNNVILDRHRYIKRNIKNTKNLYFIPKHELKKNAKRDDSVFKSIELRVLSFLECNPSNFSVLFLKGKKTMLSDTNALTTTYIVPPYKDVVVRRDTLTRLYMNFKNTVIRPNTNFLLDANVLIKNYQQRFWNEKWLDIIDPYNEVTINTRRQRNASISLKTFKEMLQVNLRATSLHIPFTLKHLNEIYINHSFTQNALHSSNSYPQKDMSKENQERNMFKERLWSGTVLESYHYLLYFYLLHNSECVQLKRDLIKQGVISF